MYNKSILFYTQNRWAFGQIHHALIKRFWQFGYYCHLLDWTQRYSDLEWEFLKAKFDFFVTTPEAVYSLIARNIPAARIVSVAHADIDIIGAIKNSGTNIFNELYSFGVVNKDLIEVSKNLGICRTPSVVRVGIDFDHFYLPVGKSLNCLGYAGEIKHIAGDNQDCKRAHLVTEVVSSSGIKFNHHNWFNHIAMPGYYTTIDALICPSRSETAGLPNMEAAAAGKLVMSTAVGYFDGSYGVLLNTPEKEFVAEAVQALEQYKDPSLYKNTCEKTQEYSKTHHDWNQHINGWINLFA